MPWGLEGVAWAVVASQAYAAVHMTWLAHKCLSATRASLFAALAPGLSLSALMIGALTLFELAVGAHLRTTHPLEHLLSASLVGAVTYTGAFLYLPIRALETEARRWKRALRLARD